MSPASGATVALSRPPRFRCRAGETGQQAHRQTARCDPQSTKVGDSTALAPPENDRRRASSGSRAAAPALLRARSACRRSCGCPRMSPAPPSMTMMPRRIRSPARAPRAPRTMTRPPRMPAISPRKRPAETIARCAGDLQQSALHARSRPRARIASDRQTAAASSSALPGSDVAVDAIFAAGHAVPDPVEPLAGPFDADLPARRPCAAEKHRRPSTAHARRLQLDPLDLRDALSGDQMRQQAATDRAAARDAAQDEVSGFTAADPCR